MAYDASAAKRTQSAELSSPRERARTDQHTAPTTAIPPQIAIDFGLSFRLPGCWVGVIVDMVAPHASRWRRPVGGVHPYPESRRPCGRGDEREEMSARRRREPQAVASAPGAASSLRPAWLGPVSSQWDETRLGRRKRSRSVTKQLMPYRRARRTANASSSSSS